MPAGLSNDHVQANASTRIFRTFNQSAVCSRKVGDDRDLVTAIALKAEVIEWFFDFTAICDKNELGIGARFGPGSEPDRASPFDPPIPNNG